MTAEARPTTHPFNMHIAVHAQPAAFRTVVESTSTMVQQLAQGLAHAERLFLVGIGTSYHAALAAEHFFRVYGGGIPTHVVHSFDFVLYGPELTARDAVVVITHTANKSYSVQALERVRATDARLVLVSGEGGGAKHPWVEDVLTTVPQEQSAAYTISYSGALAALAALAAAIGAVRTGSQRLDPNVLLSTVPGAMSAALATEPAVAEIARHTKDRRRIWLVGGGPSAITAPETALKIKEAAYLMAEGMSTEQMFHGPFQCAAADDLFVLIAPSGPAQERTLQLAGPVKAIGADYLLVSDGTAALAKADALATIDVPPVPEVFTLLSCLIPMQLLTYHYALACGTNPDSFHLDDARFMRAYRMNTL